MGSPEDHPSWGRKPEDPRLNEACSVCKNTTVLWHCANAGCNWCMACVKKNKEQSNA